MKSEAQEKKIGEIKAGHREEVLKLRELEENLREEVEVLRRG